MLAFDTGESNVVHKHSTGMLLSSPTVMLSGHTCTKVKVITLNLKTRQKQAPTTAPRPRPVRGIATRPLPQLSYSNSGTHCNISVAIRIFFCLDLTVDWET